LIGRTSCYKSMAAERLKHTHRRFRGRPRLARRRRGPPLLTSKLALSNNGARSRGSEVWRRAVVGRTFHAAVSSDGVDAFLGAAADDAFRCLADIGRSGASWRFIEPAAPRQVLTHSPRSLTHPRDLLTRPRRRLTRPLHRLTSMDLELTSDLLVLTRPRALLTRPPKSLTRRILRLTRPRGSLTRRTERLTRSRRPLTRQFEQLTRPGRPLTRRIERLTRPGKPLTRRIERLTRPR